MLMKIGGLARAIAIVLAIVAGFVALNMMNVPLVLVVLGLVAGLAMTEDRVIMTAVTLIAPPSRSFTSAITRPMSFIDEAPVSATMARIWASASASRSCLGRKRSITAISASSTWARSSRPFLR